MKKINLLWPLALMLALIFSGCTSEQKVKESVEKVISENPDVVFKAIEKNPAKFVESFQKAVQEAKAEMAKKREEKEAEQLAERVENPFKPQIREDESIRGTKGAPLTIVEYSDFECPFCSRGYNTVQQLLEKYKGKVQFIYKHLPLNFHDQAMIAAQYYEAIRLQDEKKAFAFHDKIFENQSKLKMGEKFLSKIAKDVGADLKKVKADMDSDKVMNRIKEDQKEAAKFGMQGTPGFLVNGVPLKGAYPLKDFVELIDMLKAKGKLNI